MHRIAVKRDLLACLQPHDPIGMPVCTDLHRGLQHPDSRAPGQLADAKPGAKCAHAPFAGIDDEWTPCGVPGGLDQNFATLQLDKPLLCVEADIQRRVRVQLQLRAIFQLQRATFAQARALLSQHRAVGQLFNGQP